MCQLEPLLLLRCRGLQLKVFIISTITLVSIILALIAIKIMLCYTKLLEGSGHIHSGRIDKGEEEDIGAFLGIRSTRF